jgi:hypothetical protein
LSEDAQRWEVDMGHRDVEHRKGSTEWVATMEDRRSLLERVVRYELPIEDTLVMLRAYGWGAGAEVVELTAIDAVHIMERYLSGELTARQLQHWAELLELRTDLGYEGRWSGELRNLLSRLAYPEFHDVITPSLAIRLRRMLLGEAA